MISPRSRARGSTSPLRLAGHAALALLPSALKIPLYRWLFGYRIGRGVRIGLTPLVGVGECEIGDGARIGHLNLFLDVERLEIGAHARVGWLNLVRGGRRVSLGAYCTLLRGNVLNSIPDPEIVNEAVPELELGDGVVLTTGHWLDFTDRIRVGANTVIGGRASSFWTHNRQRTRPIEIGRHCYLGSEVRVAPGVRVADLCIVAIGSVVAGRHDRAATLIGGNPASARRPLRVEELPLVTHRTRADLPDELAAAHLPPEVRALAAPAPCSTAA